MTKAWRRRRQRNIIIARMRMRQRIKNKLYWASLKDPDTGKLPYLIYAPEFFTLAKPQQRNELLGFVQTIRNAIEIGERLHISFARTRQMFADGTLFFFASLWQLIKGEYNPRMITCTYPHNSVVEQVLFKVGIFGLLNKKKRTPADHETVRFWNVATGFDVEGEQIEEINDYYLSKLRYHGTVTPALKTSLYDGLVEAMANCKDHAYIKDGEKLPLTKRRWWMFSQEVGGVLSVAFCDLGIGIPLSMRKKTDWVFNWLREQFGSIGLSDDAQMIKAAVEMGRSRTEEDYRGNGLQNIKAVLDSKGEGTLLIGSKRGYYRYNLVPGEAAKEILENHKDNFPGTLICWRLKV